jgi:hypothetical protein
MLHVLPGGPETGRGACHAALVHLISSRGRFISQAASLVELTATSGE